MKITACIIAKDEADRIGPCLESVRFCDEVLVFDSGSRDGTQETVRRAGARLVETDWPGWIAQKNRAADAAANDWILSLDADERVDAELRVAIEAVRSGRPEDGDPAGYELTRKVRYLGRWIRHGGWYPEWRVRLYDRRRGRWGGTEPHERLEVRGPVARIADGNLEHWTYRDVADHVARLNRYSTLAALDMRKRGRKPSLLALLVRPPWHFLRSYVLRLGFLDGRAGLTIALMNSVYVYWKYLKLWEAWRPDEDVR